MNTTLRLALRRELPRAVAVYNVRLVTQGQRCISGCLCRRRNPGLGCSWAFLSSKVFFGKALLLRFGFPVVIADATSVNNDSATELPEHGFGGNYGYLARSIREWQYFLEDKVFFLGLCSNDLEQRPVLIEQ